MGKRPSNGSANASKGKVAKTKGGDELNDQMEKERETIASIPWWGSVMDEVDRIFLQYSSVSEYLHAIYPDLDGRKKFTDLLLAAFPCGEALSGDFEPGIKTFALWQICWHVQAGNKGLVVRESMKNLVALVLSQGCKTDASTSPGVEFPVLQPLVTNYFEKPWETAVIQDKTFECQSIGFIKGWTRATAFLFAAHLIMKNELIDFYKTKLPKQYSSFCALKGMVSADFTSELQRIQANRGGLDVLRLFSLLASLVCWKFKCVEV